MSFLCIVSTAFNFSCYFSRGHLLFSYSENAEVKTLLHLSTIRRHYEMGFQSVVDLVERLEDRIEELTLSNSSPLHCDYLQRTVSSQRNEIKRLSQTLENKSKELHKTYQNNHQAQVKLQLRLSKAQLLNKQLQARIRELEKALESDGIAPPELDSHNSSLPPSLDLPWKKPKRTRSLRKKSGLQIGGQWGHRGSTLLQISDPNQIIVHQIEVCDHCDLSLKEVEPARVQKRQVFELIAGKMTVIEHRVEVKICPGCQRVSRSNFPPNIKAPVQYGTTVLSRIVYLNQYQLLPVARTAETMKDLFECPVSWATIQRATNVCSRKLIRFEQRIKAALRQSSVIGADETGVRLNGEIAWVHVARNERLTHLAAHAKRGREAFDEIGIVNRFTGVLVRDGFSPYQKYEQCQHSLCNAHLLRNLTFVSENEPEQQDWTGKLAKLLLKIKEAVQQARLEAKTDLTDLQKSRFSNSYDRIMVEAEKAIRGSPRRKDLHLCAHNLYRRFLMNKKAILRFMTDFKVPFDNNGSERDLRMLKLQQKIAGCFRTVEGVQTFCRVRSYLSSARKQGRGLLTALEHALNGKPVALTI